MINLKKLTLTISCCLASISLIQGQNTPSKETSQQWSLASCITYALQQNLTIRINRVNAAGTVVDMKSARAALFPSLSLSSGQNLVNRPYQETSSTVSGTEILSNSSKTSYNGNYGINAQWTLYNGGKRIKNIELQKINNQIAELDVATSENSIEESITQAYLQILYAEESVKVNESTLTLSKVQFDRGKELFAAGSIAQSDLAQLEAQVSTNNYQLVTAQSTLKGYKLQLKQLLELDGEQEMHLDMPELNDSQVLVPLPTKTDVFHTALASRPEIRAGELNVKSSLLNIKIAKAGYLPNLSLSAGIGTNNTSGSDFTFAQQVKNGWNNSIGLSISFPIFNNRQTKSTVEKAKLSSETSGLELLNTQKTLYKTIETLWLDANSSQQRYLAATEQLRSTQVSFDLMNEQFNLGMKNTTELLTEKNRLLSVKQEMLQAKYMALLNAKLLCFYQGTDIEL